jgi:hypothetical protein
MTTDINDYLRQTFNFRAWSIKYNTFIPPSRWALLPDDNNYLKVVFINSWEEYPPLDLLTDQDVILTQFTGLLDNKGDPIYEGDILSGTDRGMVYWYQDDVNSGYRTKSPVSEALPLPMVEERHVVGNVFENPKLVEILVDDLKPTDR